MKNISNDKGPRKSGVHHGIWAKLTLLLIAFAPLISCEDFVEVDLPKSQLTGAAVFEDRATATAALMDIYAQLRDDGLLTGGSSGMGNLMGLYADELDFYGDPTQPQALFHNHGILPSDATVASYWATSYNLIYATNAFLEGVRNSEGISEQDGQTFEGEGLFIRALLHYQLSTLFGEIPYIRTSDHRANAKVTRMALSELSTALMEDLEMAKELLMEEPSLERTRPNRDAVRILMARIHLETGTWERIVSEMDALLDKSATYIWEGDLSRVFQRAATGTIWQFKPRNEGNNTLEAGTFIFTVGPPPASALSPYFLESFTPDDLRQAHWTGTVDQGNDSWSHPNKYKYNVDTGISLEFSILMRLAEAYLMRAEALAQLGNLEGALSDLNRIRQRAGLSNLDSLDKDSLLEAIWEQRRLELFTEFGLRWNDLRRTGRAAETLGPIKPGWKDTDIRLPIPEAELIINPDLGEQNPGY
ncbi:RagB/SusD family nutrient uptake outer membrane protein [Sediminicola luteus]|uniref:RagB/SusD family nutrient uptake outer membrane protein n=1 Tax=Sediminicola luteus TaxID=319238 RepID=A0A2A4G3M6_9FLAO|nr:RagB/SusD family nutrient uptake outer membrane protein [Sediminicola luteus]PCE63023.1 hypothetical protein B7P33_17265 [Sediminicola luteus]